VYLDDHWQVERTFGTAQPGWLSCGPAGTCWRWVSWPRRGGSARPSPAGGHCAPSVFALLGGDCARHVPDSAMAQLAGQLTVALSRAR
jgi:hypothetical protein